MSPARRKLVVLVSSTVYGIEELLERIYTLLTAFGYEVWMSHKGTMPVFSDRSAFDNCIKAVEKSNLFLGLITPIMEAALNNEFNPYGLERLVKLVRRPRSSFHGIRNLRCLQVGGDQLFKT